MSILSSKHCARSSPSGDVRFETKWGSTQQSSWYVHNVTAVVVHESCTMIPSDERGRWSALIMFNRIFDSEWER